MTQSAGCPTSAVLDRRLTLAVIAAITAVSWLLSHGYHGITHDGRLYTLLALARIDPTSLGLDTFLKFGSQDNFTLFSPIYAGVARLIGVEPAAAALTLCMQIGLLASVWKLGRSILPIELALVGLAVFVAIPGDYGSDRVFTCIEPFITPRMVAEALVILGLAAALSEQALLAAALVFAALLTHPIMALAGVFALFCFYLGNRNPVVAIALGIVGLKGMVLMAFVMPLGQWGAIDPQWLALVEGRSPFLFLLRWGIDDWARTVIPLVTLTVGVSAFPSGRLRDLSKITLLTAASGLFLTLIGCDVLRLSVFIQLQPWRWQWLASATAALLLPAIVQTLWKSVTAGRTTALLVLAAWIFAANAFALAAAACGICSLAFAHRFKSSEARWFRLGAWALLGIAITWRVASNLEFTDAHYLNQSLPIWIRRSMSFVGDGTAPMVVVAIALWSAQRSSRRPALIATGLFAIAVGAALVPTAWRLWTVREYPTQQVSRFADIRNAIPARADVFWPEAPVAVWMVLNRPSFLSVVQTSGMVFSRASAMELQRRATALGAVINPDVFMKWTTSGGGGMNLSREQLVAVCNTREFGFLVTATDLGLEPIAEAASQAGPAGKKTRLYRCS